MSYFDQKKSLSAPYLLNQMMDSGQTLYELRHLENLFLPYANNKGTDQPAHVRGLISAFVVRCLGSIFLVSISEISSV